MRCWKNAISRIPARRAFAMVRALCVPKTSSGDDFRFNWENSLFRCVGGIVIVEKVGHRRRILLAERQILTLKGSGV